MNQKSNIKQHNSHKKTSLYRYNSEDFEKRRNEKCIILIVLFITPAMMLSAAYPEFDLTAGAAFHSMVWYPEGTCGVWLLYGGTSAR